jgi:hypothetical protein
MWCSQGGKKILENLEKSTSYFFFLNYIYFAKVVDAES